MDRKSRIVATIGPACREEAQLRELIKRGMDVARLNFSHGSHEDHATSIRRLRSLSTELKKPIAILQDLQGPKLRVGTLPQGGITLTAGQMVRFSRQEDASVDVSSTGTTQETLLPLEVPDLTHSLVPGNRILMDDGNLEVEIVEIRAGQIIARVVLGGVITSHKGVNFPGVRLDIPGFTEKDDEDLRFGLEQEVDAVAISFVRTAEDVLKVKRKISEYCPERKGTPVIAKLELPEAIENLHEIVHAADGVMVARGDLGVEAGASRVPILQKEIIRLANRHSKTVITATQMLDSMIHNPRPTRAEASDVANAIFDGTDAVMLSGETASGSYPLEAIQMMDAIVREAEGNFSVWGNTQSFPEESTQDDAVSMTRAARELAHDRDVAAIVVFTVSGKTALLMSKARPQVPVMAVTPETSTYQKMGLYWGILPICVPFANTVEGMITLVEEAILSSTSIRPGEQVVVISGFPVGENRPPNFAMLLTIGERK